MGAENNCRYGNCIVKIYNQTLNHLEPSGIKKDGLRVERKKVADVLEKIKNLPDRKRIELKKENIGEVKVIYFKFIDGRFETVFEIRKFKNDKYRIASHGTGKDVDKHFVNFETVKDFFRTIKTFKKEF